MAEFDQRPDTSQRLNAIGVSQDEFKSISDRTNAIRHHRGKMDSRESDSIYVAPDFLGGSSGLFSGNYQPFLQESLRLPRPYLETRTPQPARRRFWSPAPEASVKKSEIHPVTNFSESVAQYLREIAEKGARPATFVDFGAGSAKTATDVADIVKDERIARIIATNVDAAPIEADLRELEDRLTPKHYDHIKDAIMQHTATIARADIIELYELLQGDPVHLLFMLRTLPETDTFNDAIFKIAGEMLHPQYGTLLVSYDKSSGQSRNETIQKGLESLTEKGFTYVNPLDVGDGLFRYDDMDKFPLVMYQGPDAPKLPLYTV